MGDKTISDLVNSSAIRLACAGVNDALSNVYYLMGYALGLAPRDVPRQSKRVLTESEAVLINSYIDRRSRRETLHRILGKGDFCGLWFGLNEATLEPRPESEIIVQAILKKIKHPFRPLRSRKPLRILDLGTGSGCILLSFLHFLPNATGLGIDMAPRAIEQAKKNAQQLGLDQRCEFRTNNWDTDINERFDIISFNPPYIPTSDMPLLMPAVRNFDPQLALWGGEDGMDPYRVVVPALPRLLKTGGIAGIELGDGQTTTICDLLKRANFSDIQLLTDFRGFDRVLIVQQESAPSNDGSSPIKQ